MTILKLTEIQISQTLGGLLRIENLSDYSLSLYLKPVPPKKKITLLYQIDARSFIVVNTDFRQDLFGLYFEFSEIEVK